MTETMNRTEIVLAESNATWVAEMLASHEISARKETIPIQMVDLEVSLHNQARQVALNPDTVEMYAAAMTNGDKFPAIVVRRLHGKFAVADGNHRVAAAKAAGFTHLSAFVITEASDRQVELFTYEANTKHGLPTSLEERVRQGLYLVELGNTPKAVATALSIPEGRFFKEVMTARTEARMTAMGIKYDTLPKNIRTRVGAIQNDTLLKGLVELMRETGMHYDEWAPLVTKLRTARSEAEGLMLLQDWRAKEMPVIRSTSGGRLPLPKNVNRLRLASRLASSIEVDKIGAQVAGLDPELRKHVRDEAVRAIGTLAGVVEALKSGK